MHRLSFPYHGIPGKGSAFRLIFQMARELQAKACAVVDSDLRSITPEWIDLLLRPVLYAGYDFVAPYYHRHKYDGTITNSIVYPLTRALYGLRVRQPIGGDFGISATAGLRATCERDDWETDVARYGIDIWMTTIALAEGFRVCQSFLGAKLHDAKDPGSDLSAMLHQVVGSVFMLMEEYERVWRAKAAAGPRSCSAFASTSGSTPSPSTWNACWARFGGAAANWQRSGAWPWSRQPWKTVLALGHATEQNPARFHLPNELWARDRFRPRLRAPGLAHGARPPSAISYTALPGPWWLHS